MEKQHVMQYFSMDHSYSVSRIMKQHWNHEKFSYAVMPRPDYGLLLVTQGEILMELDNKKLTVQTGDLIFLPKNSNYEAVFEDEVTDYLVNFDIEGKKIDCSEPLKLLTNTPLYCKDCFKQLVEEQFSESSVPLKMKGLFYLLMDSIVNSLSRKSSTQEQTVEHAKQLLRRDETIRITDIAHACSISESELRKKFKKETGMSLSEYRLQFKLNKAKYLLESTNMSISEVAHTLHFYDSAYFCKIFKQYSGVTPRQFAKNKRL